MDEISLEQDGVHYTAMYAQGFVMTCSDPDDLVRSKQPSNPIPSA